MASLLLAEQGVPASPTHELFPVLAGRARW